MPIGSDPQLSQPSLLERWRALAPSSCRAPREGGEPKAPCSEAPAPIGAKRSPIAAQVPPTAAPIAPIAPAPDPASLLREIKAAIPAAPLEANTEERASRERLIGGALGPIAAWLAGPPSQRDPQAAVALWERAEDILEALLLPER